MKRRLSKWYNFCFYKPNAKARSSFLCLLPPLFFLLVLFDVEDWGEEWVRVDTDGGTLAVVVATDGREEGLELVANDALPLPHAFAEWFVFGFPPIFDTVEVV
jgi:hypothetical protein